MMMEQITTLGLLGRVMVSIMRRSPRISSRIASQSVLEYCACRHVSMLPSCHPRGRQQSNADVGSWTQVKSAHFHFWCNSAGGTTTTLLRTKNKNTHINTARTGLWSHVPSGRIEGFLCSI